MHVVLVYIHVKPEGVEAFRAACERNASASRLEPGVVRFDVLQNADDPNRFVLYEAYRTPEAVLAHKETAHYLAWRKVADPLMAETRQGVKYSGVLV